MKLVIGLGNPGAQYEITRHNVGFLAIDYLVEKWGAKGPVKKSQGEVFQADFAGHKIHLIKPQTFMNLSGKCVGSLYFFYHCKPQDLIIIHDDLDLPAFSLKLKEGGGTGGHNGLESIQEHLGKENFDFYRVRMGIGHPRALGLRISPADYVLESYGDGELKQLEDFLAKASQAIEKIFSENFQKAMTEFNKKEV